VENKRVEHFPRYDSEKPTLRAQGLARFFNMEGVEELLFGGAMQLWEHMGTYWNLPFISWSGFLEALAP